MSDKNSFWSWCSGSDRWTRHWVIPALVRKDPAVETSVMLQFLWFSVETQYYLFCGLQCLMVEHRTTNTQGCIKASLLFSEPYRQVRAAHRATEWFVSSGLRYRSCFQNYWANCHFRFSLLFQQGNESAEGPSSWLRKQGSVFQVSCTSLVEDQTPTNKGTFS